MYLLSRHSAFVMLAAAELQAASRALLPSSSEDEDSSENEDKPRRKRQAGSPTEGAAGERTHTQPASKRRKKDKKERKRSHRDRAKKDAKQAAEQERIIARELAAGAHKRQGAQASAWAAASGAAPGPSFFQDTRGDPGNVAFGAMYRGDIAAYHRLDPTALSSALRGKGGRQGSADQGHTAASAARRRVPVQRWVRLGDAKHSGPRLASTIPSSDFLPLDPSRDEEQGHSGRAPGEGEAAGQVGGTLEAPEGYLLRRTRDFNAATREHPESLQTWLDFAAFQDEVLATIGRRRRGSRQAAAEKKISILEKALEHHPGSDELLNALLDAAAEVCDAEELELRWRRALAHFGGSAKLWKAYIHRRRGQFSGLSVPEVADAYRRAAVALRRERERRIRQGVEAAEVVAVERDIVEMLLEGAEFHLQTGHTERGCAQVQAMLEFNFFAPEGKAHVLNEINFGAQYMQLRVCMKRPV